MQKTEKIKYAVKLGLGAVLLLGYWWATITGYTLGDPIDPLMLFWGIVFVFATILGPIGGILIWPFLVREVFVHLKRSKSPKND